MNRRFSSINLFRLQVTKAARRREATSHRKESLLPRPRQTFFVSSRTAEKRSWKIYVLSCSDYWISKAKKKTISHRSSYPISNSQFVFHIRSCKGINWLFNNGHFSVGDKWNFFLRWHMNLTVIERLTQNYANQKSEAWIRNRNWSHKSISTSKSNQQIADRCCNNWYEIPQKCLHDDHKNVVNPPCRWHRIVGVCL